MKNYGFLALVAMVLTACSSDNIEEHQVADEPANVVLTFSPYEMTAMSRTPTPADSSAGISTTPLASASSITPTPLASARGITRSATSIANIVTHLDVWLYEGGSEVTSVHQSSGDDNFGSITVALDKNKTYTLYAVGHKADGATLEDGVISFTDDKVTHSMFYSTTFSPATTTSLSCLMNRIVADFRLEITDEIPTSAVKFRFTIASVFDRWNVTTGGTHGIDRVSTINYGGTSAIFNVYAIVTDASTTHDILVEALDENDGVVQSRTFADVPLRNGYKTNYRGTFFIDTETSAVFTVDDWNEYDVVDF